MPRLFTGLELSETWRARLGFMQYRLAGASWVDPENYHLTLRFAGDLNRHDAGEWADRLATVRADAFRLRLAGLGAFGGDRPHSLWAGVAPEPALMALQRAHERAARQAGLPPETRKYAPHVTLARLRGLRAADIAPLLAATAGPFVEPLVVEAFVLFSARDHVGGGPYVVEERFPLHGAGRLGEGVA